MLSERNWQIEGVARMLIGLVVTSFCLMLLAGAARQFTGELSTAEKTLFDIMVGAFIFQGMALIWAFIFIREQRLSLGSAFGIRLPTLRRALLFGILVGITVVPIAWLLQIVSVQILTALDWNPQAQELVRTLKETTKTAPDPAIFRQQIAFGISVILLAPIAEEILFRGILYPTIKNLGFPRIALWTTAILFALMHKNLAGMVPFVFLGIVLVKTYEETDNLLAPILTHSLFNAANFLYMLYEVPINRILFRS